MSVVANVAINIDGKQAKSLLKSIQSEVDKLNGSFGELEKPTQGFGASIKDAAGSVIGQLAAVTGAAFTLQQAFTTLSSQSKAEAALRTLGVDADVATQQFKQLSKELQGQASVVELTTAAYDVASAGFANTADQTKILEAATKGAVGGLSDINTVGNAVTSVLNAYGMSASQAGLLVDGFIQTQNDGKIVLGEYAALIGRLAPTAAAAGVGIKELNAAVATITAQGVAPETAITGLNQALVSILKPTTEAAELSRQLGIDFSEAGLRSKGLAGFLDQVSTATGGSVSKLTTLFGSVDALKAILPLLSGDMQKFVENILKQDKAAGVASKAFNEMSATLEGSLKEIDTAFKNLVVAFKPVVPAIIAPIKALAVALNVVADNIKGVVMAAAFIGTFAGVLNAAAIATKAWAVVTGGLALALKAAGVAKAFLVGLTGAGIALIATATVAATGAAVALGAAMSDAGVKAAEAKGQQSSIADETARLNGEINRQMQGLDQIPPKMQAQIEFAERNLNAAREQSRAIDAQIASLQRGASINAARYQAEAAINNLHGKQLEQQYQLADTAQQRMDIAVKIFEQQMQAAQIEYRQELENIKLEQRKVELQYEAARTKYQEIEAEGKLQILKASSLEEEIKKKAALDEALASQNAVIKGAAEAVQTQSEIVKYQEQTAAAQLETKKLTAQMGLEQKLVSKEIGLSDTQARSLSKTVASNITQTSQFAVEMSKVAGQTERAASAMQRLQFYKSQGSGSSTQRVPAFAKGGIVTRPTLAIVGEGGESEYIVPESKAALFSANYLSGARGETAIDNDKVGSTSVNITTGPVMQQDGQKYVSLGDLESAMQQVVNTMMGNNRSAGGRRYAGIR